MKYLYYPGCTLYEKARNFDASNRASARALDVELEEPPNWTCCGTCFPLNDRKIVGLVAPTRILVNARRANHDALLTICTFCYNVLKRANYAIKNNEEQRKRINAYLEDEFKRAGEEYEEYGGQVEVVHLLEVLRDKIGFDQLQQKTKRPLGDLKVAPYYGCLLLRPAKEMKFDDVEHPTILEDTLRAIGCDVIDDFPHKLECCGSYLGLSAPDVALESSYGVIRMAKELGADVLAVVCPLCAYNLDQRQGEMSQKHAGFSPMPVLYFTQLLGLALEQGEENCCLGQHSVDPMPLLRERQLI